MIRTPRITIVPPPRLVPRNPGRDEALNRALSQFDSALTGMERGYNGGMKHFSTARNKSFFKPLHATGDCQAAMMTLQPGQSTTDQPENEHPRSEQWLFVISGSGRAIVGKKRVSLKEGSLLLVEKNEPHQIRNTGRGPMRTINFYAPPAYTSGGNVRPGVKVAGMLTRVVDALS